MSRLIDDIDRNAGVACRVGKVSRCIVIATIADSKRSAGQIRRSPGTAMQHDIAGRTIGYKLQQLAARIDGVNVDPRACRRPAAQPSTPPPNCRRRSPRVCPAAQRITAAAPTRLTVPAWSATHSARRSCRAPRSGIGVKIAAVARRSDETGANDESAETLVCLPLAGIGRE